MKTKEFRKIPGNIWYEVSIENEVRRVDGEKMTTEIKNGKMGIDLYGVYKKARLEWLKLLAWFELEMPDGYKDKVWDIKFKVDGNPYRSDVIKMIPVLNNNIYLIPGYKMIPTNPRYGMNDEYEIYDSAKKSILKKYIPLDITTYPTVNMYDPIKKNVYVKLIHRLVAIVFISNDDYKKNWLVNHLDGDKHNYKKSNLEWTDTLGNNIHATETGLRSDVIGCKTRDFLTGEVKEHASAKRACVYMGVNKNTTLEILTIMRAGNLIKNRYEVKRLDDNTPWFYEGKKEVKNMGDYTIIVTLSNGVKETYYGLKDITRKYFPDSLYTMSLKELQRNFSRNHKDKKLTIVRTRRDGPYQAMNLDTGEVHTHATQSGLARQVGYTKGIVNNAFYRGDYIVVNNLVFRLYSNDPWDEKTFNYQTNKRSKKIIGIKDEKKYEFTSLRDAMRETGINRTIIKRRIETKQPINGWLFSI